MLIAHLTDTHVRERGTLAMGRVDTNAMLASAVAAVGRLSPAPEAVIVTGDLVESGAAAEYAMLKDLLAPLAMPVYLIPGNHDDRANLRAAFAGDGYLPGSDSPFLHYVVDGFPLRLIALDSHVPGAGHGELCAARLAWLESRLAEAPDKPALIMLHHPPFATGLQDMDAIACRDGAALGDIVARHPAIERVLCGHHHRPIQVRWRGTLGCVAPSTAHQVALDLRDGTPAMYNLEPPGFLLHLWRPGTGVITHTAFTGDFAGPFYFRESDAPAVEREAHAG